MIIGPVSFYVCTEKIDYLPLWGFLKRKYTNAGYSVGDTITFSSAVFGGTVDAVCTLAAGNFNSSSTYGSINFEISDSQQTEVILEILKYSGVIIRDPQVVQAASQELQQEEINSKR